MNKKTAIQLTIFIFFTLFFIRPALAQKINSYDELFSLLPGGSRNIEANRPVIENAQKRVAERQMLRRRRAIKFIKPISFDVMNEKYASVSFQAEILPRKDSVYAILFEINGENPITFPNTIYLSWVGSNDLKIYNDMKPDGLYASYQEMGIDDCKPGYVRTGMEKALLGKADVAHTHSAADIVSGTIPESMIDTRIARVKDLNATISVLESKIAQMEKKIDSLSETFSGVSRINGTIVFSGVNVQIVNGKGGTGITNGKGNLIVGYNEGRGTGDSRDGSHNIIVGSKNSYSSTGGIVTGFGNTISGKCAAVIGGNTNTASGDYSTIVGGEKNHAKGRGSNINGMNDRTKVSEGENPHFKAK